MLKAEFKYLKEHRFMMLVLTVLCIVPAIYAVPFLGSLWDTYGKVDQLPVVVVNQDQAVDYRGKKIDIGKQLTRQLADSDELDFTFKNEQQAKKELAQGKAYMMIRIPKDFSHNATTLLDQQPKQMTLDYQTSSGHSFIAGKLSESAAERLRSQVAQTVTKAYTKAMFDEIKGGSKQLAKAADGNQKLSQGAKQAQQGSAQLVDGLANLANGTLTFSSGANQLNVGLQQYVNGVSQAQQGNQQVGQGLQTMQSKLPQLSDGVSQLSNGQASLTQGLNQAARGQVQLNDGIKQYTQAVSQLANGSQRLSNGLSQAQSKLQSGNLSSQDMQRVEKDLQALQTALQQDQLAGSKSQVQALLTQLQTSVKALNTMQTILQNQDTETNAAIDQVASDQKLTSAQTTAVKQAVTASQGKSQQDLQQQMQILQTNTAELQKTLTPLMEKLASNQAQLEHLQQISQKLPDKISMVQSQIQALEQVPGAFDQLNQGLQQLNQQSGQLQSGSQALVQAQSQLATGSQQLSTGINVMANQVPTMQQGVSALVDGNGRLQTGLNTLAANGEPLTEGSNRLSSGAAQLNDGAQQLQNGGQQLTPALGKIKDGNQTLAKHLDKNVKKLSDLPANHKLYQQFAKPVKTKHHDTDHVANNGTGMAPYMFSVGLYVGMLAINLMVNLVEPRTWVRAKWRWIGSKLVILFGLATVMAIVLFYASKWILGMHFVDATMTLGLLILIAWMDAALVTALNFIFGRAGSFATIVLLVAQLSLSAGTYPIQLSPELYQKLHAYVPMTYSVDGLRQTMMIGGTPYHDITVMIGISVVSLIAMVVYYYLYHRRHLQTND